MTGNTEQVVSQIENAVQIFDFLAHRGFHAPLFGEVHGRHPADQAICRKRPGQPEDHVVQAVPHQGHLARLGFLLGGEHLRQESLEHQSAVRRDKVLERFTKNQCPLPPQHSRPLQIELPEETIH